MLLDLVKSSRSFRGFCRDRKVSRRELEYLVECARYTPSAKNGQVLKYYLVNAPEELAKVLPCTKWAGALKDRTLPEKGKEPTAFVVICYDETVGDGLGSAQRDVGIAAQTMMLAARELGLGGCMIGAFSAAGVKKALDLPEHLAPQLLLALGEPLETVVVTDARDSITYYRDQEDVHYVPKRTLEELILNK